MRIQSVESLRGIAAFIVMWAHFGHTAQWLKFAPGSLGVFIFFVISGFVIPYAMQSVGYTHRDAGRFILRRLVRLEPPYLVAVVVMLALMLLSTS